ncbi:fatty acid-binding protein [Trichomonascus vanleenenianus]|uniref:SCP2 sterol-binding domain-containing protein n=1 Tax=Trichomonascus vanleenenianus TaxID=2268995 RepID=UPI003ECA1E60
MSVADSKFPSSAVFDLIKSTMESDAKLKAKTIKQADAVVVFNLKNKQGETQAWYLDLKKDGAVGKGAIEGADLTLSLSDEHFGQLVQGKANAQKLFMTGKLKVKGNVMKAASIEGVLSTARSKAKL